MKLPFDKPMSFEIRVITGILLSLIFIVVIASLAYNTLSGIVQQISESVRPDAKLLLAKEINSDLSDAESSVKSYTITHDDLYLQPFYNSISSIDNKLSKLKMLTEKDSGYSSLVHKLEMLTEEKFVILDKLIGLQEDNRVETTLSDLKEKIETEPARKGAPEAAEKKGTTIFDRIFRNRKKPATPAKAKAEPIGSIQDQIDILRWQEKERDMQGKLEQLDLTRKDKQVMDRIRLLISELEQKEHMEILKQTGIAQGMAGKANGYIATLSILLALLLLLLCFVIIRFIRRNTAYNEELARAKRETEKLAKAKEVFLANMSHEIRTPLHAIAGFTEQLMQADLKPEEKENLVIVKKSSDHLLKLISNILDFSKLEAGKFELRTEKFMVRTFFDDISKLMQPLAVKKGIGFQLETAPDLPESLIADPLRLNQVMINLISNAIKFTAAGEVSVKVRSIPAGDETVQLQVLVQDTGIGIAEENLAAVFREFEQEHAGIGSQYGGTGLGLSISRRLVQLMGGDIHIKSKQGKGTVVELNLPVQLASSAKLSNKKKEIMNYTFLKGTKILFADDEEYNRKLLAIILNKWEVDFAEASNGIEVLEALDSGHFDMLLLDLRMPEMDGMEAARHIRELSPENNGRIPIIALTASAAIEVKEACRNAGIDDLLVKPFKEEELLKVLFKNFHPEIPNESKDGTLKEDLRPGDPNQSPYKLDDIYVLAAGNRHFVIDMIDTFIKSTREKVEDIKQGVKEFDWNRVSNDAHCMIGPARHIDANGLLSLFKRIESIAREKEGTLRLPELALELELEANSTLVLLEKELDELRRKN